RRAGRGASLYRGDAGALCQRRAALYFNGSKTTVNNFEEYEKLGKLEGFKSYLQDAGSIKLAYPEFKYYIMTYLAYAAVNAPEIYLDIIGNTEFKVAFQAIDQAYSNSIDEYHKVISDIRQQVGAMGQTFSIDEKYIWIGNMGIGNYQTEFNNFSTALENAQFEKIYQDLE
ncbi:MAG: hypothetical protein AAGC88_13665, partial [Bacteroidota bacterium]